MLLDSSCLDVRFALRGFRRAPVEALTVVVTLTVALGLNATAFSVFKCLCASAGRRPRRRCAPSVYLDRAATRAPLHVAGGSSSSGATPRRSYRDAATRPRPGHSITVEHSTGIGQVFFVPCEPITMRPCTSEELSAIEESRQQFNRHKAASVQKSSYSLSIARPLRGCDRINQSVGTARDGCDRGAWSLELVEPGPANRPENTRQFTARTVLSP